MDLQKQKELTTFDELCFLHIPHCIGPNFILLNSTEQKNLLVTSMFISTFFHVLIGTSATFGRGPFGVAFDQIGWVSLVGLFLLFCSWFIGIRFMIKTFHGILFQVFFLGVYGLTWAVTCTILSRFDKSGYVHLLILSLCTSSFLCSCFSCFIPISIMLSNYIYLLYSQLLNLAIQLVLIFAVIPYHPVYFAASDGSIFYLIAIIIAGIIPGICSMARFKLFLVSGYHSTFSFGKYEFILLAVYFLNISFFADLFALRGLFTSSSIMPSKELVHQYKYLASVTWAAYCSKVVAESRSNQNEVDINDISLHQLPNEFISPPSQFKSQQNHFSAALTDSHFSSPNIAPSNFSPNRHPSFSSALSPALHFSPMMAMRGRSVESRFGFLESNLVFPSLSEGMVKTNDLDETPTTSVRHPFHGDYYPNYSPTNFTVRHIDTTKNDGNTQYLSNSIMHVSSGKEQLGYSNEFECESPITITSNVKCVPKNAPSKYILPLKNQTTERVYSHSNLNNPNNYNNYNNIPFPIYTLPCVSNIDGHMNEQRSKNSDTNINNSERINHQKHIKEENTLLNKFNSLAKLSAPSSQSFKSDEESKSEDTIANFLKIQSNLEAGPASQPNIETFSYMRRRYSTSSASSALDDNEY